VEWAAIDYLIASGRDLDAAILITKIQVRAILEYLNKPDRPVAEFLNSYQLIFRCCSRIGKLQLARKELAEWDRSGKEPEWVTAVLAEVGKRRASS